MDEFNELENIYIIKYKIYQANGGSFKYASNAKYEDRIVFYKYSERQEFIKEVLRLHKVQEQDLYVDDIKIFKIKYSDIESIDYPNFLVNFIKGD